MYYDEDDDDEYDYEGVRSYLLDYFGTGMTAGFGAMTLELPRIDRASNEELKNIARKNNINIEKYRLRGR